MKIGFGTQRIGDGPTVIGKTAIAGTSIGQIPRPPQPSNEIKELFGQTKIGETKAQTQVAFLDQHCSTDQPCRNFYINGIRTPEDSAQEAVAALEKNIDAQVELIYNPAEGLLQDSVEAIMNLSGMDTKIAEEAASRLGQALENGEKIRIFAHSQGAAITADALNKLEKQYKRHAMTSEQIQERFSQVEVITFGGFATQEAYPDGVQVQLLNKQTDFIPQYAQRFQEIVLALKSDEDDLEQALKNTGTTLAASVAFNGLQAVGFGFGKIIHAAAHNFYGKNLKESALDYVSSVVSAVQSDHSMTVNDKFTGEITKGYIEEFKHKYV